jgi:hypothetical protein
MPNSAVSDSNKDSWIHPEHFSETPINQFINDPSYNLQICFFSSCSTLTSKQSVYRKLEPRLDLGLLHKSSGPKWRAMAD